MRDIYYGFVACRPSFLLVAAMAALSLVAACAAPPVAVNTDPGFALDRIRSVYVLPFTGMDDRREAGAILTQALKEQLRADGILRVVDQPGLADAYFQGTVEKWVRGGLGLSGTRATKIGGSLTLLDPAKRHLWSAAAEQRDPLRLLADGVFARDPSALAPHWVRTVLQQLPGYTVQRHPTTVDIVERFLAGESIDDLARAYAIPPQEVERILRQELTPKREAHGR
jgi:hypothetical protein